MEVTAPLDDLVDLQLSIGPAGRSLRETPVTPKIHVDVQRAVRDALAELLAPSGHEVPAATWLVGASRPA